MSLVPAVCVRARVCMCWRIFSRPAGHIIASFQVWPCDQSADQWRLWRPPQLLLLMLLCGHWAARDWWLLTGGRINPAEGTAGHLRWGHESVFHRCQAESFTLLRNGNKAWKTEDEDLEIWRFLTRMPRINHMQPEILWNHLYNYIISKYE